jgi:tetratricopeptide (TPR) repeat protein
MTVRSTISIQSSLNKQRNPRYVLASIVFTLLMLVLCNTADAAWIGVAIEDSLSDEREKRGIKIIAVDADGPGARAGLRVGDLIALVDGETVETCLSLARIVRQASEGKRLKMIIWRKSEWVSIELILAARPQHVVLYQRGWEEAEKGNYQGAIRYFTEAIDLNPMDAESYYGRGIAYSHEGQYDRAISDYTKALEINPKDARAYCNRGNVYCRKGEYDRAISDYTKALETNPRGTEAYYNRGITWSIKGQHDQAISDFRKALEINPNNPRYVDAYVNQEIAYYEEKSQYDQAISDYTEVLDNNPGDAKAYINGGRVYYLKRGYGKSWKDFEKAPVLGDGAPPQLLDDLRKASGR